MQDLQHQIDELNRTLAYGGVPALGRALAGLDLIGLVGHLVAAIATLEGQLAATQAQVASSRHSEAFARWAATYQPVKAKDRNDAPFGGFLFDTSDEATAHVRARPEALGWMLISDGDAIVIVPGFRPADRLGHFICAVARHADAPTEVVVG